MKHIALLTMSIYNGCYEKSSEKMSHQLNISQSCTSGNHNHICDGCQMLWQNPHQNESKVEKYDNNVNDYKSPKISFSFDLPQTCTSTDRYHICELCKTLWERPNQNKDYIQNNAVNDTDSDEMSSESPTKKDFDYMESAFHINVKDMTNIE